MKSEARQTLADFLRREIGEGSVRSWAMRHGLRPMDVSRALGGETGMSLDKLQLFAVALGAEPWQLLFPGYERGAPQFPTMSFEAVDLARRIDAIADEGQRRRMVAAFVNMLEALADHAPPQAAPSEPTPLARDTTRKQVAHP